MKACFPPFPVGRQASLTAIARQYQFDFEIRRWQMGRSTRRPLDQPDAFATKIFVEAGIEKFIWTVEAIEIKMI